MLAKARIITIATLAGALLSGCASGSAPDEDAGHHRAMQEIAMTYGAQSGLHWKSQKIAHYLDQHAFELDKVYNFNALLMRHNVMPPVVTQLGKTYTVESADTVHLSDKEYILTQAARFVSVAPSWREYIYLAYAQPDDPPTSILPQSNYEKEIWKKYVQIGWESGIAQAEAIFQDSLSKLNHDYEGMILYHVLHIQNMISAPYVETTNLGITGNSQSLRLNDKVIKIQNPSVLNPMTNQWQPILVDQND